VVRDRDLSDDVDTVVRFVGAPTGLMQQARLHLEAITREFQLIEFADADSPPARLLELITRMRTNYDQLGFEDRRRVVAEALERADDTFDFELPVPPGAANAARLLIATMEETDEWCERGELLTLASPREQRAVRRWFFGEIERQSGGAAPIPWSEFDDRHDRRDR
jgi:hypothetical protein